MKTMLENYMNGNLTDAKTQAKRYSWRQIVTFCQDEMAWSTEKSANVADYLKVKVSFQAHCDRQYA